MKFIVYSKNGCPYCEKIQKVLEISNLDHTIYYLDEDFTKEQFWEQFGEQKSFPQVILNDGISIGGCVETVKFLKENNIIN